MFSLCFSPISLQNEKQCVWNILEAAYSGTYQSLKMSARTVSDDVFILPKVFVSTYLKCESYGCSKIE